MASRRSDEQGLPRWRVTRWLTQPATEVPIDIRVGLLAGVLWSVPSVVAASIATMIVSVGAAIRHPEPAFVALASAELLLFAARMVVLLILKRGAGRADGSMTDVYLLTSVAWAALIGTGACLFFSSGDRVLEVLAPVTMVAIIGGIATRNHGVPRLAILQMVLCDLPFTLAALAHPERGMLILVALCPLYVISMTSTVYRLHRGYLQIALAERENERRANHDALTGLWNRPGLMAGLADNLRRLPFAPARFALFYLDLDGFKAVNDRMGHAAGDLLLQRVADRFRATVPAHAIVARIGGDEFVIVVPGIGPEEAALLARDLVQVAREPAELDAFGLAQVGVSIGIACPHPGMTPDELLAEADGALYRAKAGGKGCVVVATRPVQGQVAPDHRHAA